jgi:outer membrane protein OmpA-like peptidoglycan-associated protein
MKKTLLLLTLCAASLAMTAQTATNRWNIGAGIGFTDFVNPINKQFLMVERWKGNANFNVARYLGKSFDGRLNVSTGNVYYPFDMNQASATSQTVPTTFNTAQKGKMRYENSYIWDGGLNLVYKFANGYILKENSFISPYLFSGLGINSITKIGTQNGKSTGGAGSDQINPYIPVGFGLGFNLNDKWTAAAEYGYKFALGEAYNYGNSAFRLGYNFGGGAGSVPAATAAASNDEPAPNANWCNNYNWKVGVGPTFNSFEGPITGQNFLLDQFTTSLGLNVTKYLSKYFDARANLGFGNVFYPYETDKTTNYPTNNKYATYYKPAQMIDLNLQAVLKFANGTWMSENAIFSPYVYAGPGANYITSIGNWNAKGNNGSTVTPGTDDFNMHLGTGLGFNFRTSDKFSIQLEGGRNWNLDNSFNYNQASLRGVYALGNCAGSMVAPVKTAEVPTTKVVDSDNDGIPDLTDECPYVAGKAEFFGCPDSDGDGIGDSKDKCPFEAGVASNGGCPEVAEVKPVEPVKVEEPVKTVEPVKTTPTTKPTKTTKPAKVRNVLGNYEVFFTGCSTLSPGQVETLQNVATQLRNNPNYTVEIAGNTAKGGSKSCSQERANKIASLLRMKGVNVSNAKKVSYGSDRPKYNSDQDNRVDIQIFSFD